MRTVLALCMVLVASTEVVTAQSKGLRIVSVRDDKGQSIDLYDRSYALLIGVSKYTAGWPSLESVPSELEKIEIALKQNGFTVQKVIDPTGRQLSEAFEQFVKDYGYDKGNRLLFVYSGHGWSRKNGEQGYLVPSDAPDPQKDEKEFLRRALDMTDILGWCKKMEARHALFLFDSCFSGTIFKTRALPEKPPHITALTAKPVRQFITAGEAGQAVPAKSVFAACLLQGLSGEADLSKDGYITGTELGMFLHDKVIYYKTGQTPQYGKMRDPDLDEGDFVFLTNRSDETRRTGSLTLFDGTYEGEIMDGKPNGQGTLTYTNGCRYIGEFKDGRRNGQGTWTEPRGEKFVCEWRDDQKNGQGVWTHPDGLKYVGEFKDDNFNGHGTYIIPGLTTYTGEFTNGVIRGQGTMVYTNGFKMVGDFDIGGMIGAVTNVRLRQTRYWPDGSSFVGEFWTETIPLGTNFLSLSPLPPGTLCATWFLGSLGSATYANNALFLKLQYCQGTHTNPDGTQKTGFWQDGKYLGPTVTPRRRGSGQLTFGNGTFEGQIENGKADGYGAWTHPDGTKYIGEWKEGKRNGEGISESSGGEKYLGDWTDDKRNGQGTLTKPDGTQQSGVWKDDVFVGPIPNTTNAAPAIVTDKKQ